MKHNQKNKTVAQPFLKWAGGKRQLLQIFEKHLPKELKKGEIENYYEPFLGSGAMFFFLIQNYSFKNVYLADTNDDLILTYLTIKNNVDQLIEELQKLQNEYHALKKEERKKLFYSIRSNFNSERKKIDYTSQDKNWTLRAAQLIFLNKTCFNGLFRLNSKGEFNTPAGDYKNPRICDKDNLAKVSFALKKVNVIKKDFRLLPDNFKKKSFVYLDPPYRPISKTSSFTSYSNNTFSDVDQKALAQVFAKLDERGGKLMLSNSDPKNLDKNDTFFDDLYNDYAIKRIPAKRSINSNASKRGTIKELLITNY